MKPFLEYAAGFFDGEGCVCIFIPKEPQHYRRLQVQIVNTNEEVLLRFKKTFEGCVNLVEKSKINPRWKDSYTWTLTGGKAYTFLNKILPFLIVKKTKVELAIKFMELKKLESLNSTWISKKTGQRIKGRNKKIKLDRELIYARFKAVV